MWRAVAQFFILLFLISIRAINFNHLMISTYVGRIRGKSAADGNYTAFMGIPYATLNNDNLFLDSIRYPRFKEPFYAINDGIACYQIVNNRVIGTRDCLVMNIYVPRDASVNNRLPVMVFFHPSDYSNGFSGRKNWGPKYLVRHNVIVVTLNYRLGIFGFMCLDIPEFPGNQGLRDQLLGLKWIRENIYWFGGDIERITLFGNSDSSRLVDLHLLSSKEKLFNNVILQSGTALDASWLTETDPTAPVKIVQKLGHMTNDTREAVTMMAAIDPAIILLVANELGLDFKPCVEKTFFDVDNFLSDIPVNQMVPKVNGMSVMIGVTQNEAALAYEGQPPEIYEQMNIFSNRLSENYDFSLESLKKIEKVVREFYIGDEPVSYENRKGIIDFDSDFLFVSPAVRTMRKFLENNAEKVYFYVFSYNGQRNYGQIVSNISINDTTQGDELGYLFDMKILHEKPNFHDHLIIDRMTTMWTNFAKANDPTPANSRLMPVNWTPVTQGSKFYYLDINKEVKLLTKPFHPRMDFWNMFHMGYGHLQKSYRDDSEHELLQHIFALKPSLEITNVRPVPGMNPHLKPTCVLQWGKNYLK